MDRSISLLVRSIDTIGMKIIEAADREPPDYEEAQLFDNHTYRSLGMNPIIRKTCIQVSGDVTRDSLEDILGDIMEMDTVDQSTTIMGTYPPASLSSSRFMVFNNPDTFSSVTNSGIITQQPSGVSERSFKSFLDVLSASYGGTQRGDSHAGVKLNCSLISSKSGIVAVYKEC